VEKNTYTFSTSSRAPLVMFLHLEKWQKILFVRLLGNLKALLMFRLPDARDRPLRFSPDGFLVLFAGLKSVKISSQRV
jgi:hypothetical protein